METVQHEIDSTGSGTWKHEKYVSVQNMLIDSNCISLLTNNTGIKFCKDIW